jgi:hypothetical protein
MFIIRSNLFIEGTQTTEYFSKYSVQISVLHRPSDINFNTTMSSLALKLHRMTGESVVFFPLIDAPEDWSEAVRDSDVYDWWRHEKKFKPAFDDALVGNLCRFFHVQMNELPVLVISPSLSSGAYLIISTSPETIEKQFEVITSVTLKNHKPSLKHLRLEIESKLGVEVRQVEEDTRLLAAFYQILEQSSELVPEKFFKLAIAYISHINQELKEVRSIVKLDESKDELVQEKVLMLSNRLFTPAWAEAKKSENIPEKSPPLGINVFSEYVKMEIDSKVMIDTALMVGWWLSDLQKTEKPRQVFDYTPAAQGFWKAFENEMNYSLVQIERASLGIDVKKYYTLFQPDFPREKSMIDTPKRKDLNQQIQGVYKHKFLPLGDNWYVFNTLLNSNEYQHLGFVDLLTKKFGFEIASQFMDAWKTIRDIRNEGSHVAPLQKDQYDKLFATVRETHAFPPLVNLKQQIISNIST